jgi:dTDP-4-dehydrorhamnose 3,5-epimerase
MTVHSTPLAGAVVAETLPRGDHRGQFARWFCERELAPWLGERRLRQINFSRTLQVGALRGLHFRVPPHAEVKLVRCLRGRVWDVAVDLRAGSPTYLQWHAVELCPANGRLFVIPEGFAHGFQVLEPETELLYLHSEVYHPPAEGGVRHDDPRVAVRWPLPVSDLSARDRNFPLLADSFTGLAVPLP